MTHTRLKQSLYIACLLLIRTYPTQAIDSHIPRAPSSYSVLSQFNNHNILNFDTFIMCSYENQNIITESMGSLENNILDFLAVLAKMKKPVAALSDIIRNIQSSPHDAPSFLDIPFSDALTQARALNQSSPEPTALTFDRIQNDLALFDCIEQHVITLKQGLLARHYPLSQIINDVEMIIHTNMRYIHLFIQLRHLKGITPQTYSEILTIMGKTVLTIEKSQKSSRSLISLRLLAKHKF